jgi:hypothetical protein
MPTPTPLLEEVANYLAIALPPATYGQQGLLLGVNMFLARTPEEAPNACVTVGQYQGKAPAFTMGRSLVALDYPRIQIAVRGEVEDYPGAWAWSQLIRQVLMGVVLPDATYFPRVARIESLGVPNPTGYDDVERPKFTANFQFHINANTDGTLMP